MSSKNSHPSHADIRASLRNYLNNWEAWERQHHTQASIPTVEWNALIVLARNPFMQYVEDSKNYLSPLFEREHQIGSITRVREEEFADPLTNTKRFRMAFKLPGGRGEFPREGHGFPAGEEAPSFSKKMKARQFAAKCALAFLDDNPNWAGFDASARVNSSSGSNSDDRLAAQEEATTAEGTDSSDNQGCSAPLSQNPYTRKRVKLEEEESQEGVRVILPKFQAQILRHAPKDQLAATLQEVETLARSLQFGKPRYEIQRHEDGTYFGKLKFSNDGRMPSSLGTISGANSESHCKFDMAQGVLAWLRAQKQTMEKSVANVLEAGS